MRSAAHRSLKPVAAAAMLLAALCFIVQATLIMVSRAGAAVGSMPQPGVMLADALHYHDDLARHVHSHGGGAGHVHLPADQDDGTEPSQVMTTLGAMFIAAPDIPAGLTLPVTSAAASCLFEKQLDGFEPVTPSRPPSTLDIA
jgi:hypothetical protein